MITPVFLMLIPFIVPVKEVPDVSHGRAAYFVALETIASTECPKLGYKVNPNGWHALVEHEAPDSSTTDYQGGGKYEDLGRAAFNLQTKIIEDAGPATWCAYLKAWARAYHPWINLIAK